MKAIAICAILAASLFVAACLPVTTRQPVGASAGFHQDQALVGVWKGHGENDDKTGFIAFLNSEGGDMNGLMISPEKQAGDWDSFSLKIATLGGNHYMTATPTLKNGVAAEGDEAKANILLLYRLEDGKLTLYLLDEKRTAAAIKAGRIEGEIGSGDMPDIRITAEPKAQDAFFASKEAAALFDKTLIVLSRVE